MKPVQFENIEVEGVANIKTLNVQSLNSHQVIIHSADTQNTSLVNKVKGNIKSLKNGIGMSLYPNDTTVEIKSHILNKGTGKKLMDVSKQRLKSLKSDGSIIIKDDDDHIYLSTGVKEPKEDKIEREELTFREGNNMKITRTNNDIFFDVTHPLLCVHSGTGFSLLSDNKLRRLKFEGNFDVQEKNNEICVKYVEPKLQAGENCRIDTTNRITTISCHQNF